MGHAHKFAVALLLTGLVAPTAAGAQDFVVYPSKGQSQEQQNKDRYECHLWAVQQSGFDPTLPSSSQAAAPPPPPPPAEAPQGGLLRGAGRGAAVGAVGGAIGGDAGKGAAIGAATGALLGGMRRRDQRARMEQQQLAYEQQQAVAQSQQGAQSTAQREKYDRGLKACLEGRGYGVD